MADTATKTAWRYTADYLEFCNCAYGCSCNFNGFPSHGNCRGAGAYQIREGSCGDVDLAGIKVVSAFSWPGAIHEGKGTLAAFFDPSTSEQQMQAMGAIFMGEYGGLPHEILSTTVETVLGPFVEPIELVIDGTRSSIRVGEKVSAQMTPHVSPMDASQEQEVHIVIPDGFIFRDGSAARNTGYRVNVEGLSFEDQDTNAFYAVVEHSN
jgi:hypothetical protein